MKKLLWIGLILWACTPVSAQVNDNIAVLNDKLDRMERDLTFLQRKLYQNAPSSSGIPLMGSSQTPSSSSLNADTTDNLFSKISAQENLISGLTEKIEKLQFELDQATEKMAKMNADFDVRFKMLEDAQKWTAPVSPEKAAAPASPPAGTVKEQYEAAYNLLKKGDHVGAEKAFLAFIENNPQSDLAGNANYWLGETYYARGQYERAIVVFAEGFTTYKKNAKAPDSLLKLGMAMAKANKKSEACTAFHTLPQEFPKASKILKDRAKDEAKKLTCP